MAVTREQFMASLHTMSEVVLGEYVAKLSSIRQELEVMYSTSVDMERKAIAVKIKRYSGRVSIEMDEEMQAKVLAFIDQERAKQNAPAQTNNEASVQATNKESPGGDKLY